MGAQPGAPRFELAEIVRTHRAALESCTLLSAEQRRVLTDITQCRTAVLGGHMDVCESCGYEHPSYNSCRNRHCPKCQALVQQRWIDQRRKHLLDVPHFHVVFTLPAELRPLAAFAPTAVYTVLFECAAATLRAFAHSRLGATLGATLVLHTWTKDLRFHPHVHAIVTGGGLDPHDRWVSSDERFLFPVVAMSRVFRGKTRTALRARYEARGFAGFQGFADPEAFARLLRSLGRARWYVYAKRSFDRAKYVLEYLGRYTHRVALSNSRIVAASEENITIRTRGARFVTMPRVELLRRFLRHVLPPRFHKIRHFGLYAGGPCSTLRTLGPAHPVPAFADRLRLLTGRDITLCARCGAPVVTRALPPARAPPGAAHL